MLALWLVILPNGNHHPRPMSPLGMAIAGLVIWLLFVVWIYSRRD